MINKKYMNYIIKQVKKNNEYTCRYFPNEKETDFLKNNNIIFKSVELKKQGLYSIYTVNYCRYYFFK